MVELFNDKRIDKLFELMESAPKKAVKMAELIQDNQGIRDSRFDADKGNTLVEEVQFYIHDLKQIGDMNE